MDFERFKNGYRQWSREYRLYDRILPTAFLVGVLLYLIYFVTLAAPLGAPTAAYVKVTPGESATNVAEALEQRNLIHSATLFELFTRIFGTGTDVIAGEYFFPGPNNVILLARRIAHGDYELVPVRVTIPEGASSMEIGIELAQKLPDFDQATFLTAAKPDEGYLFPDTYFFLPGEDPTEVISSMEANFNKQIAASSTQAQLQASGKSLKNIVIMASLLEKEAADTADRRIISGILWHRITLGMPLQVDAVFPYIIGVNSLNLTRADLQVDSPYNTYTHTGLPPGPIANPGLDALLAAMTPIQTNYLYYLSDLKGNFHYCTTYACQESNAKKYLGN